MISMAVHELATNAAKYGALSVSGGQIDLTWNVNANGAGPELRLGWLEKNGPPVAKPNHQGFGMRLLERGIQSELGGRTLIEFAPSGMRCELNIPLMNDDV
jgi:two-component sensor histidine kinase